MIEIRDKKDCSGCSACVQKCPKQCIFLKEDEEGFLYPVVDTETCIDCGLCEKVCPVLHQGEERKPLKVYAAKNQNEEIRKQSSSGGIFTLLAEEIIKEGGVVFGARFDEKWEVKHDFTETIDGLDAFRGSKYVQSRIEDNFQKVEAFLKQGRKVLFSGTPCQVAGLKLFLRKEYDNLLTVDFVCHGVPSPAVWRQYLKEIIARMCDKNSVSSDPISMDNAHIESISFRNKSTGWKKYSFALTLSATSRSGVKNTVSFNEIHSNNVFMRGFLANLYLRPSCYKCIARKGKSGGDIQLADFWGINRCYPLFYSSDGVSLILNYTKKGNLYFDALNIYKIDATYEDALNCNINIVTDESIPKYRNLFFQIFNKYGCKAIYKCLFKLEPKFLLIKKIIRKLLIELHLR